LYYAIYNKINKLNILVEGEIEEDTSYDKTFVTIDKNTKI